MSDDDREMDIDSAEKRAHHNALERKRRDHIKDSFTSLRESVPALQGEKVASRALILKKAADYIQFMQNRNTAHQQDIDDLKRQNSLLEAQIRTLEKSRPIGVYCSRTDDESEVDESSDRDNSDVPAKTVKKCIVNGL